MVFSSGSTLGPADVVVESWLETCPMNGMVPLKVKVRNRQESAGTWVIKSRSSGATSEVSLTVDGRREGERMFYAPIIITPGSMRYRLDLDLSVTGPGIDTTHAGTLSNTGLSYGADNTEFIAVSAQLHALGWSGLEARFKSLSSPVTLVGSKVEMNAAPEDWRGYSGLAQLWLAEGDWTSLSAGAKTAIFDWVAMGGELFVLSSSTTPERLDALGFPKEFGSIPARGHGAGTFTVISWSGTTLPQDIMFQKIREAGRNSMNDLLTAYAGDWALVDSVGPLALRTGLIFGFILIFGLLVGPVNLFLLAPAGRRQRLFWTTPLISLAGSGLLMVLMVVQDGFGGTGARTVLAFMMPEQKHLLITQEQVAKTGVLAGSSFSRKDADLMLPVQIQSDPRRLYSRGSQARFDVSETEDRRTEGWFSSRSVQAHLLRTVRPSRATVELHASAGTAAAPHILSTVESPLKKVFLVDDSQKIWKAEDVGTGEKKVLRPSDIAEFAEWLKTFTQRRGGPVLRNQLEEMRLQLRPGLVYAEAEDVEKFAIATLDSIRWNDQRLILAGPYVKR